MPTSWVWGSANEVDFVRSCRSMQELIGSLLRETLYSNMDLWPNRAKTPTNPTNYKVHIGSQSLRWSCPTRCPTQASTPEAGTNRIVNRELVSGQGIIHRDMKLENVLVANERRPSVKGVEWSRVCLCSMCCRWIAPCVLLCPCSCACAVPFKKNRRRSQARA